MDISKVTDQATTCLHATFAQHDSGAPPPLGTTMLCRRVACFRCVRVCGVRSSMTPSASSTSALLTRLCVHRLIHSHPSLFFSCSVRTHHRGRRGQCIGSIQCTSHHLVSISSPDKILPLSVPTLLLTRSPKPHRKTGYSGTSFDTNPPVSLSPPPSLLFVRLHDHHHPAKRTWSQVDPRLGAVDLPITHRNLVSLLFQNDP
jgi:hypothetical protein